VREHAELLARGVGDTSDQALPGDVAAEFRRDAGQYLGAVSGLLEGPCGEVAGLSQLRRLLPPAALDAFDGERARVLALSRECMRFDPAGAAARDLIVAHLRDTVVTQREFLLRSVRPAVVDATPTDLAPSTIAMSTARRSLLAAP